MLVVGGSFAFVRRKGIVAVVVTRTKTDRPASSFRKIMNEDGYSNDETQTSEAVSNLAPQSISRIWAEKRRLSFRWNPDPGSGNSTQVWWESDKRDRDEAFAGTSASRVEGEVASKLKSEPDGSSTRVVRKTQIEFAERRRVRKESETRGGGVRSKEGVLNGRDGQRTLTSRSLGRGR